MAHTAVLLVSNIHCPSCVSCIQDVLHGRPGVKSPVDVSLIHQTIRVQFDDHFTTGQAITDALLSTAFEVQHVTIFDEQSSQISAHDLESPIIKMSAFRASRDQRKHIQNCEACQREKAQKSTTSRVWAAAKRVIRRPPEKMSCPPDESSSRSTTEVEQPTIINIDGTSELQDNEQYTILISIEGMTCASCSGTIRQTLEKLDSVESVNVNLVGNNAKVVFRGPKENSQQIVKTIEDLGYDAVIDEWQSSGKVNSSLYKASLCIKGMTCGSCVANVTKELYELPFVSSIAVDLVSHSGTVEFHDAENLGKILGRIDDLGYEATLVRLDDLHATHGERSERTVELQIDGMYCGHCPDNILFAFEKFKASSGINTFMITERPSLQNPRMAITYKPSPALNLTVRTFVNLVKVADNALAASVYHPPTIEERSRRIQHKERWFILRRLIFTALVAIPTFIIGVVFMSIVPAGDSTRMWFEQPIWKSNVMRGEWAMLIMTTPVMFFGADMFHRRAFNEIWSMWRPRSRIPLLQRFYRFGSMNLLVSAGTMVAYISSLAVLTVDATSKPMKHGSHRSSDSYFDTVTFLSLFILIGRFLEAYSKAKTGDAVAKLSKLRPAEALLLEDALHKIPVDQLEVGDIVQIPHGLSPPTDGIIDQDGFYLFDESSLTGESRPVKKTTGDSVFTGTVNISDPVKIKVTEIGGTSMLDQIVDAVREGQAKRAKIERLADILTGYFVPVITLLAILTWIIWLGLGQSGRLPRAWLDVRKGGWAFWSLEFAIAVFVVACPCGIGLAAPTALFVGGGLAAKYGILVQGGGEAFQEASRLNAIVFDKTGTLTQGQMKVTDLEIIANDIDEKLILAMSRAMEEPSTHPIAKAIADRCQESSVQLESLDIKEVPGQGMIGRFIVKDSEIAGQYEAAVGNERLLDTFQRAPKPNDSAASEATTTKYDRALRDIDRRSDVYLAPILQKHQSLGHSTAIFALRRLPDVDGADTTTTEPFRPVAVFSIADPIRSEAPAVLRELRESRLDVYMCTGDNQTTAHAVASQLGIPVANVRAGVLPQDKAAYIRELQRPVRVEDQKKDGRKIVGFVGDGTNDTPALSAADVSIALSSGSDVALTTASFILLNSDLNTILELTRLAKRVFLRVKLNFAWAAVYNVCLIPVAAGLFFFVGANEHQGGWRLAPVWASLAMALSSISVVLSSLALRLPEIRWTTWRWRWGRGTGEKRW